MDQPEANAERELEALERLYSELELTLKTKPYLHQIRGLRKSGGRPAFAQLGEQGTGKTWILINEAAILYKKGLINRVLVLAPKGVDMNWLNDELPAHMPLGIKWTAAIWRANARRRQRNALIKLMGRVADFQIDGQKEDLGLRILMMNWDAIATHRGYSQAEEFLGDGFNALIIGDEIHRVREHSTKRAKALMKLKELSSHRRAATGTPILNNPFDGFVPFTFLSEQILGTDSYYSFKGEYAQIQKSGGLYDAILERAANKLIAKGMEKQAAITRAKRRMPQILAKDETGKPLYRNLSKLQEKVDAFSFRVLKSECLDLPEKIYKKVYYELTEEQTRYYTEVQENMRVVFEDQIVQPLTALTSIGKLMQITSGFVFDSAEHVAHRIPGGNPKLDALADLLTEDIQGKAIVWASLVAEIDDIRRKCRELGISYVEFHGGVDERVRQEAIRLFQHGDARVFIGNPKSGGTGLTLHAASNEIYYSNTFSLEARLQSEDRAHRIGQRNNVIIWDLVAEGTIDERIISALQDKSDLAALVNGDLLRALPPED